VWRKTWSHALILGPIWFAMNWTFNQSLSITSVTSSTVIASTSSVFTMLLSWVFLKQPWSWINLFAVAVTILGSALVAIPDAGHSEDGQESSVWGDLLSLVSAALYGLFSVALKKRVSGSDQVLLSMLYGLIGGLSLVVFLPIFAIYLAVKFNEFQFSGKVLALLFVNGMLGVSSDFVWAHAVLWTSPLTATIGLSLTIPVAAICDWLFFHETFSVFYILGAVAICSGFLASNWNRPSESSEHSEEELKTDGLTFSEPSPSPSI